MSKFSESNQKLNIKDDIDQETKECFVCCSEKKINKFFKCVNKECNFDVCIECSKKYLLTCIQDEHCMNCKNAIPYDSFLNQFDKTWVFGKYKTHKETVLIDIEKQRFKDDMAQIALQNEIKNVTKEIEDAYTKYRESIRHLEIRRSELYQPKNKTKYISNFQCPSAECNGFLDKDFKCGLCSIHTCKKCYVQINEGETHECNEEQIETFKKIKEESKTCPSCGEFISKISGCDQMFCVKCGTAFSWKTGQVEKGVVHNPHAHTFFQNNPRLGEIYRNNINGNNGNGCRAHLPQMIMIIHKIPETIRQKVQELHRTVAEFRVYYRNNYTDKIENDITGSMNKDYREQFLKKNISETRFKQMVHMRYKRHNFNKQIANLIRSTFDIIELILWEIADSSEDNFNIANGNCLRQLYNSNVVIYDGIMDLIKQTNNNLINVVQSFGYRALITLRDNMRGFPYRFKN